MFIMLEVTTAEGWFLCVRMRMCVHICVAVNIQQELDGGPSVTGGQT